MALRRLRRRRALGKGSAACAPNLTEGWPAICMQVAQCHVQPASAAVGLQGRLVTKQHRCAVRYTPAGQRGACPRLPRERPARHAVPRSGWPGALRSRPRSWVGGSSGWTAPPSEKGPRASCGKGGTRRVLLGVVSKAGGMHGLWNAALGLLSPVEHDGGLGKSRGRGSETKNVQHTREACPPPPPPPAPP